MQGCTVYYYYKRGKKPHAIQYFVQPFHFTIKSMMSDQNKMLPVQKLSRFCIMYSAVLYEKSALFSIKYLAKSDSWFSCLNLLRSENNIAANNNAVAGSNRINFIEFIP